MPTKLVITHINWGYIGGGVDSALDSYLQVDKHNSGQTESRVIVVRPVASKSKRQPDADGRVETILHRPFRMGVTAKAACRIIAASQSNVVFLNGFNATIFGYLIRHYSANSVPIVSTYHGPYHGNTLRGQLKGAAINALERFFLRRYANQVIAVSRYSARELIAAGVPEDRISVVYNGIPDNAPPFLNDALTEPVSGPMIRVISVSRLVREKGLDVLLEAFSRVVQRHDNVQLLIVGSGPEEGHLHKRAAALALKPHIQFLGQRTDIAALLTLSDIFATTTRFENHSIAILEAMRAGLPVVATDVGGNPESIRHGKEGLLVPVDDVIATEEALVSLLASSRQRSRMARAGRARFTSEFSIQALSCRLTKLLRKLMANPTI